MNAFQGGRTALCGVAIYCDSVLIRRHRKIAFPSDRCVRSTRRQIAVIDYIMAYLSYVEAGCRRRVNDLGHGLPGVDFLSPITCMFAVPALYPLAVDSSTSTTAITIARPDYVASYLS